ncbi:MULTISPECIES: hypothetical protein [unclassified Pseudomonas]|uniref:hypothetical protein n=1 Tax=unclassified Pseudomonas TaxID=196821 RepID=UPI0011AF2623|nr:MULTISPECIES: hypothetical protein [unclassified Pseudomonas]
MVNAVSFSLLESEFAAIPVTRRLERGAMANEHGSWIGVDYLILCSQHCPIWVAKIEDIVLSREDGGPLSFRFSEIRSVARKGGDPEYGPAFKPYRSDKYNPQLTAFDDESFFTIGDPVPFIARPDTYGPLSMEKAILGLAETYGVDPKQVEITIRSKPAVG